jgi:hypothetical protein
LAEGKTLFSLQFLFFSPKFAIVQDWESQLATFSFQAKPVRSIQQVFVWQFLEA